MGKTLIGEKEFNIIPSSAQLERPDNKSYRFDLIGSGAIAAAGATVNINSNIPYGIGSNFINRQIQISDLRVSAILQRGGGSYAIDNCNSIITLTFDRTVGTQFDIAAGTVLGSTTWSVYMGQAPFDIDYSLPVGGVLTNVQFISYAPLSLAFAGGDNILIATQFSINARG